MREINALYSGLKCFREYEKSQKLEFLFHKKPIMP